jgi:hypothetical protein
MGLERVAKLIYPAPTFSMTSLELLHKTLEFIDVFSTQDAQSDRWR